MDPSGRLVGRSPSSSFHLIEVAHQLDYIVPDDDDDHYVAGDGPRALSPLHFRHVTVRSLGRRYTMLGEALNCPGNGLIIKPSGQM